MLVDGQPSPSTWIYAGLAKREIQEAGCEIVRREIKTLALFQTQGQWMSLVKLSAAGEFEAPVQRVYPPGEGSGPQAGFTQFGRIERNTPGCRHVNTMASTIAMG